jgi:hypothetical protein
MIPYKEISKLKGKTVKIKFVTHGNIENIMTVLMVDSRRGFKNDTIKVLVNGEMDYYIDTTKIISIKPGQNKVK